MNRDRQKNEQLNDPIEQFKSQVRDENLILRMEQLEQDNIYEVFQTVTLYEKIYE